MTSEHPVSPTEESEVVLSPEVEPERSPEPGIGGTPVRCKWIRRLGFQIPNRCVSKGMM